MVQKKIKVGSLVADNYSGNREWSIGVVTEVDYTSDYCYKICYPDDDDTDWYNAIGASEMFENFNKLSRGEIT